MRPVVVPHHQQDTLPHGPEVLPALVHVRHVVGDLKQQALPVLDLIEHLQQVPESTDKQRC